jgi:hypothetical protein
MILFEYFAHDAIGTSGLGHASANGYLVLVAAGAASGALEVDSAGAVLPTLAQRVQLTPVLLQLSRCRFQNLLVLLVLVCF